MLSYLVFPPEFTSLNLSLKTDFKDKQQTFLKRVLCAVYIHGRHQTINIDFQFIGALKETFGKSMPDLFRGYNLEELRRIIRVHQYFLALRGFGPPDPYTFDIGRYNQYYSKYRGTTNIDEIASPFIENWSNYLCCTT